jgi:hypothetical protein
MLSSADEIDRPQTGQIGLPPRGEAMTLRMLSISRTISLASFDGRASNLVTSS